MIFKNRQAVAGSVTFVMVFLKFVIFAPQKYYNKILIITQVRICINIINYTIIFILEVILWILRMQL